MDIDDALGMLARAPVPSALAHLRADHIVAIANEQRALTQKAFVSAAIGALFVGIGGGALPVTPVFASPQTVPFGAPSPLAPSSLLGG